MNTRALEGLTLTERKVIEEFSKGLRPKEIAQNLGISIRTVYKALYKYRRNLRNMGLEEEAENFKVRRNTHSKLPTSELNARQANLSISNNFTNLLNLENLMSYLLGNLILKNSTSLVMNENNELLKQISELILTLKTLNDTLNRVGNLVLELMNEITKLNNLLKSKDVLAYNYNPNVRVGNVNKVKLESKDIPSFLIDNPWIEVLRMRGRE